MPRRLHKHKKNRNKELLPVRPSHEQKGEKSQQWPTHLQLHQETPFQDLYTVSGSSSAEKTSKTPMFRGKYSESLG